MNSFNTNTHDFRSKRKCFSLTGCLIFVLFMSQASCRPSENDDVPAYPDGDYTDADDIEWQNFPIVETTTKDHPIIYYKEDIVSEDYDPKKENKSSSKEHETSEIKPLSRRKYKEISRRNRLNRTESYRYIKPEKVYFDVYPIEDDGVKEDDTKFNENDIDVEVISLVDENNDNNNNNTNNNNNEEKSESKRQLNKRTKKYSRRHRQRRDVLAAEPETSETAAHALRHKRNPYHYRITHYSNQVPQYRGVYTFQKHPIRGIYINAGSANTGKTRRVKTTTTTTTTAIPPVPSFNITNRIEPVWDESPLRETTSTTTSRPPRRTAPPLIHSGDEDYVPAPSNNQGTTSIRNPIQTTAAPDFNIQEVFASSSAGQWNQLSPSSPQNRRTTTSRPPPPPPPQPEQSRGVSACIWAITACCGRTENIRYRCFESMGCSGAFWDLNPCADDIYRSALNAVDQYLV